MTNKDRSSPHFALYGIIGAYNYGTESIVRGTEIALRTVWPDCRISYISPQPEDDRRRLFGSGVQIVPRPLTRRYSPRWIGNVLFRLLGKGDRFVSENLDWLVSVDAVLSVGGDLYTLPPQNTFVPEHRFYATQLLDTGQSILNRGIALAIWGASIGPFESWPDARRCYSNHLSKVPLITVREPWTVDYLRHLGIHKTVRAVGDPAFLTPVLDYRIVRRKPDLPLVGVNLSPLSVRFLPQRLPDDSTLQLQADTLVRLATEHEVELLLLPHVISSEPTDDDRQYLSRLFEILQQHIPDQVGIINDDPGAQKMKGILKQCSAVITARMHCGVHAASVGTPALFLAYSAKAHGMSKYIYGDEAYCLSLEDFVTSAGQNRISNFLLSSKPLRTALEQNQPRFIRDANQGAIYLQELMRSFYLVSA